MGLPAEELAARRSREHVKAGPMEDAKRRRDAAAAAFDDMDTGEGGPGPAGPAHFSAAEVEEPDNRIVLWM